MDEVDDPPKTLAPIWSPEPDDVRDPETPTPMSWPDPDSGPWAVMVHWREIGGRAECVGIEFWNGTMIGGDELAGRQAAPITATGLRDLRPDALIKAARQKRLDGLQSSVAALHDYLREQNLGSGRGRTAPSPFAEKGAKTVPASGPRETRHLRNRIDRLQKARPPVSGSKPRGRPAGKKWAPEHWQEVADIYREAWRDNHNPTAEVSVHFDVGYSTAATWISRCRAKGLLEPTTQGKPTAGPTKEQP